MSNFYTIYIWTTLWRHAITIYWKSKCLSNAFFSVLIHQPNMQLLYFLYHTQYLARVLFTPHYRVLFTPHYRVLFTQFSDKRERERETQNGDLRWLLRVRKVDPCVIRIDWLNMVNRKKNCLFKDEGCGSGFNFFSQGS